MHHQTTDFGSSICISQSIESQIERWPFPEQPSNELRQIDGQFGRRRSADQSKLPPARKSRESRWQRELERTVFGSQPRYPSPGATLDCGRWCEYSDVRYANIVSLGRLLQEHSDLILAGRPFCPPARPCSGPGKAQGAR